MRTILVFLLMSLASLDSIFGADALYRKEVNQKNPGGKDLILTFEETRREEKSSTAKVTFSSGASVASSMFIMDSVYGLARSRSAKYWIKLKEWKAEDGGWMYLIGFSPDNMVDPKEYFGLSEPLPKSKENRFMAVRQSGSQSKEKK